MELKIGDRVTILEKSRDIMKKERDWNDGMTTSLGKEGKITSIEQIKTGNINYLGYSVSIGGAYPYKWSKDCLSKDIQREQLLELEGVL